MLIPTPAQIRAKVSAVLDKVPEARVIGIRSPLGVELGESLHIGDADLAVARGESVLDIRDRMAALADAAGPLVLLTPIPESELGADVMARLAKRQLFGIEPWQLLKDRFRARFVDPRLVQHHPWVAHALLEAEPDGGYPPAPSGFIQADLVWDLLFATLLGVAPGSRDAETWIEWGLDPERRRRAETLQPDRLRSLGEAVEASGGAAARLVFGVATGPRGGSVLAVGLVARVLFGSHAQGDTTASKAAGKLEGWLGAGELTAEAALNWADAAESVTRRLLGRRPMKDVQPLLDQADALLAELGAADLAHHSAFLAAGFEQRLRGYAQALAATLKGKTGPVLRALAEAADSVRDHALALHEVERIQGVEMGGRLARWLAHRRDATPAPAGSFVEAAGAYRREGGHVDWARSRLWEGDTLAPLGQAYASLRQAAGSVREAENRRFGELLANWAQTGSHAASVIVVEECIERVVAPLAAACPLLLVVIDGMGMAVFRELQDDLVRRGWVEIDTPGESRRLPVIAALPTVTEVSRTSLLCGALCTGSANEEKAGFANHPALLALGSRTKPPLLFHKGDLSAGDSVGVAPTVLSAIADDKRRLVGVVINAVDDHLAKGDQIRVDWTVHRIKPLEDLLAAARDAGRALAIVSDHGHIPEHGTVGRPQDAAERWREAGGLSQDDEVLLVGPRVVLGQGHRILAPWSERVRFSGKKNGYHGGASPQEVVIPLGLFAPAGVAVAGWVEVAPEVPAWWDQEFEEAPRAPRSVKAAKPRPPMAPGEQGRLFPTEEEVAAAAAVAGPEWIDRLLASPAMAAQRQMASRVALPEERIRAILMALDERGGKLTRPALAKRIEVPPMRLGGVLSALRRVLNIEGYAVLSVDEQADTVELNLKQLFTQFGLS